MDGFKGHEGIWAGMVINPGFLRSIFPEHLDVLFENPIQLVVEGTAQEIVLVVVVHELETCGTQDKGCSHGFTYNAR